MFRERRLGIKTFLFYFFQKFIFSLVLFIIAVILPTISRFIITNFNIDSSSYDMISKLGSLLVVLCLSLSFLFVFIGFFMSLIKYLNIGYTLDESSLKMRIGIVSKREIYIPYNKIQNVNIQQSVVFRMLGLAHLVVQSAGDDENGESDQVFEVIDISIAEHLRDELLSKRT